MPDLRTPTTALSTSHWTPVTRSVASWLTLTEAGTIEAGPYAFAQRSAVRAVVHSTVLSKEAGFSQVLSLQKDHYLLYLRFSGERWEARWGCGAPLAFQANPALIFDDDGMYPPVPPAPVVLDVPYVPAPIEEPEAAPRAWGGLWTLAAPLLLVAAMAGVWASAPHAQEVARHCRFDENRWLDAPHTLCTHAFLSSQAAELLFLGAGVLLFGWIACRSVGFWRTLLLFAFSAAMSVGLWRFLLTPLGHDMLVNVVGKAIVFVAEKFGPEAGWKSLLLFNDGYASLQSFRGPVCGPLGAVAGMIAFVVLRGDLSEGQGLSRLPALLLGVAYLGAACLFVWPSLLGTAVPVVLLVGGLLGGAAYCFPDMALEYFCDELQETLQRREQE